MQPGEIMGKLSDWHADHGYRITGVSVKLKKARASKDLENELTDWQGASGWIARQSGVIILPYESDSINLGNVISAELTIGDNSLQIRRVPDAWMLTHLIETKEENTHLADEVVHVTVHGGAARYSRYWSLPKDGATEIVAWRFIGFEEII